MKLMKDLDVAHELEEIFGANSAKHVMSGKPISFLADISVYIPAFFSSSAGSV